MKTIMISGGLKQYVTYLSEPIIQDFSLTQTVQLICPTDNRIEIMENLWEDQWEITRSGPVGSDFTNQLICAVKTVKL